MIKNRMMMKNNRKINQLKIRIQCKKKQPLEDEGKKAVRSIEGEELLNIMAGGIISDASQVVVGAGEVVEGAGEVKPNVINVEMHFDDE